MKKILIFVVLFICSRSVVAQFFVNNFLEYNKSNIIIDSGNFHNNIKIDFCRYDSSILLSPFVVFENEYDFIGRKYSPVLWIANKSTFSFKRFNMAIVPMVGIEDSGRVGLWGAKPIIPQFGKAYRWQSHLFKTDIAGFVRYNAMQGLYLELGRGKTFLGDGYRSLLLSDNAPVYSYFRGVVDVWKIKYFYQIARMAGIYDSLPNMWTGKYVFTHYLSINIGKRFNFSMFETVIQSTYDSLGVYRSIELSYLNPVVFWRSVEFNLGSPDNVLVGFSGHLQLFKTTYIYGQLLVDEFLLRYIRDLNIEYWGEKYAIQLGYKCSNTFGVENLFTQAELNAVRPFTYSHSSTLSTYTHQQHSLAHPFGSNFVEGLFVVNYKTQKSVIHFRTVVGVIGKNTETLNYGQNPNWSYNSRFSDTDVKWLVGDKSRMYFAELLYGRSLNFYNIYLVVGLRYMKNVNINSSFCVIMGLQTPFYTRYREIL